MGAIACEWVCTARGGSREGVCCTGWVCTARGGSVAWVSVADGFSIGVLVYARSELYAAPKLGRGLCAMSNDGASNDEQQRATIAMASNDER